MIVNIHAGPFGYRVQVTQLVLLPNGKLATSNPGNVQLDPIESRLQRDSQILRSLKDQFQQKNYH